MRSTRTVLLVLVLLLPGTALAQEPDISLSADCQATLKSRVGEIATTLREASAGNLTPDLVGDLSSYIKLQVCGLAATLKPENVGAESFLTAAAAKRTDLQVGAAPSRVGTTTLVSDASAPPVLGFALEHGAVTADKSGSTVTLRGTPLGIFNALSASGYLASYRDADAVTRFLRNFSASASFDMDRGDGEGASTVSKLSEWSLQYHILNPREPRAAYLALQDDFERSTDAMYDVFDAYTGELADEVTDWAEATAEKLTQVKMPEEDTAEASATYEANLGTTLREALASLPAPPEGTVERYRAAFEDYLGGVRTIVRREEMKPVFSIEIRDQRFEDKDNLTTFGLAFQQGWKLDETSHWDLSLNASLTTKSIFGGNLESVDLDLAGLKDLRELSLAGEAKFPFANPMKNQLFGLDSTAVLSVAMRYQRRLEETTLAGNVPVPDSDGNVWIGQLKLEVPFRDSGLKMPLSLTVSNRTELIQETDVRGNFGFTFDLESLLARGAGS